MFLYSSKPSLRCVPYLQLQKFLGFAFLSGNTQEDLCNAGKGLRTGGLPNLEAIHAKSITGKSWAGKLRASGPDGEVEWVLLLGASLFGVMGDETPMVGKKRP